MVLVLILFLFLFDSFVVFLRPLTLTLRVLINISLGHFIILFLHQGFPTIIIIFYILELFVYLVQSYVFFTLSKSYLDVIS